MPAQGTLRDGGSAGFHLIETMRWEPGVGAVRGEKHLARLARSAGALGFAFDETMVRNRLATVDADGALRLRLTLRRDGEVELETFAFAALPEATVWKVAIAATRLGSGDPLLVHKTSRRDAYEAARAEFSRDEADEVLLLNERGEVCEGTITNVFAQAADGRLFTPSLQSGLLAGILREEMIERGEAAEGTLFREDLAAARQLYVGNSLRGLIRAGLVPGAEG